MSNCTGKGRATEPWTYLSEGHPTGRLFRPPRLWRFAEMPASEQ